MLPGDLTIGDLNKTVTLEQIEQVIGASLSDTEVRDHQIDLGEAGYHYIPCEFEDSVYFDRETFFAELLKVAKDD